MVTAEDELAEVVDAIDAALASGVARGWWTADTLVPDADGMRAVSRKAIKLVMAKAHMRGDLAPAPTQDLGDSPVVAGDKREDDLALAQDSSDDLGLDLGDGPVEKRGDDLNMRV